MEPNVAEVKDLSGRNRFKLTKVLANTLQGRIYLAQDKTGKYPWAVVKETWRELVKQGKSRDGHKVPENFEREKSIQLFLSSQKEQNEGYVRCIESWEDDNCFYLAMEYCGAGELFDFIRDNHTKGELSQIVKAAATQEQKCQKTPNAWSLCVESMFRQLVDTVSWMHSNGIAHLDLSLENTMLASVNGHQAKVKIIDFGLAKHFKPNDKFNEKVGKVGYMGPEVYGKKDYSPQKADIWCLGVMLFMMLAGAPPYEIPNNTNPAFRFIIGGRLREVLTHWRRLPLVSSDALDVMEKIFRPEEDRISMEELRRHRYVGLPDTTRNVAVDTQAGATETTDDEATEQTNDNKEPKLSTTENDDQTLKIQNELIPLVQTKKALDISQQLRSTVGVQNMRALVVTIEQSIEETKKLAEQNVGRDENPKGEGVIDENNKHVQCVHELTKLLQVVTKALENMETT